jgi:PadR family transcriptional regulator
VSESIGEFEQLILFALVRLGADAYGVTIRQEIEDRTGRSVSSGALYTALDRLERRGLVASRLGDPTPERGGKRKRLYTLQPVGGHAVARVHESLVQMTHGIGARLRAMRLP